MKVPEKPPKPSTGPSQKLVSRINHLRDLLRALPNAIPLNPPVAQSTYHFALEDVEDRGVFGALSHSLEVCLGQTHNGVIEFKERGQRLENLISMIKDAVKKMSEADHIAFESAWLERLIKSAENQGARHPKRKHTQETSTSEGPARHKCNPDDSSVIDLSSDNETNEDTPVVTQASASTSIPHSSELSSSAPTRPIRLLPKKFKQSTLNFGKDMRTEEQKQADRKARMEEAEEKQLEYDEKMARLKKNKEARDRELNRLRVQKHREKKKAEKDGADDANTMLMDQARKQKELAESENDAEKVLGRHGVAEVSRVATSDWRDSRNGTLGGAKQGQAERTNWYHPFLWVHIAVAMIKADWSSEGAVKILQRDVPHLFKHIHRGTIYRWKVKGEREWKVKTLEKVKLHHAILGSGRTGALTKYPHITDEIKSTLLDLRRSGMIVNVPIARSIMLGIIKKRCPSLLNSEFQCSERYVRQFFQAVLNWSPRAGTRAAAHLPADAEDVCERSLMQIVYAMQWYNIPPKLLLNGDQMGIYVLPNSSRTYHPTGEKQVDVVAKDEKRAFTLFVTSTADGDFLPFQQIWGGKTKASTPSSDAPGMNKALDLGFDFTCAASAKSP
ncbi:hypothetical protein K435DRAFT_877775 [Dendrothele bispora CBS 962.96]|uniref:Uncharacterized protein n=1 Tax=Dendrothele bispora (strain CBS 962.96) TaxID=1314807 RepID=A0A4S8KPC6_DENBC|nr:hypothetical protein K435DRAFT_877775 [Dendrothele bispora CBS 962.96]